MVSYQPYLYARTLDEDVLQSDFDGDARGKNYYVGERAFYRRVALYLPVWRYLPYDAIVSAKVTTREFLNGG